MAAFGNNFFSEIKTWFGNDVHMLCGMQLARHLLLTDVVISQIKGMIRQLHSYETMGFNFCSERGSDIKQWK